MRPLSELLQLVYDELNDPEKTNGKYNIYHPGICSVIDHLRNRNNITLDEKLELRDFLFINRPKRVKKHTLCCYFWLAWYLPPRNRFLKKHIKLNKEKENGKSKIN